MSKGIFKGAKLAVVMAALSVGSVQALDWTIQPRVFGGFGDYSLTSGHDFDIDIFDENNDLVGSIEDATIGLDLDTYTLVDGAGNVVRGSDDWGQIGGNAPMLGLGVTLSAGRFIADLNYQALLDGDDHGSCYDNLITGIYPCVEGTSPPPPPDWREEYSQVNWDRGEVAASVGYIFNDPLALAEGSSIVVFGGWRDGEMDWDQKRRDSDSYSIDRDGSFELDGPFAGVAYTLPVPKDSGAIQFRVVYGDLDGELSIKDHVRWPTTGLDNVDILEISGEADAWSFGMNYSDALTESIGFSLGLDYHVFDFDVGGGNYIIDRQGQSFFLDWKNGSLKEELWSVKASLVYVFGG